MIRKKLLYITVLFGVASFALPAFAQGSYRGFDHEACEKAVIDKLVEHGAKEDDIKSMNYVLQHSGSRSGKVDMIGIEYWVELGSSEGRAVVELTENCQVTGAFTRRGLRLDGLRCFGRGCR